MTWPQLELEDTFGDILRKAMRGHRLDVGQLSRAASVDAARIDAFLRDDHDATHDEVARVARALHLVPDVLYERATSAWQPTLFERADIRPHAQRPHPSNGYVIVLADGKRAALVDPAGDARTLLALLDAGGYELHYILATHKHDDHTDALAAVAKRHPDAVVVIHPSDRDAIGEIASQPVEHGGHLDFCGEPIAMYHTPGHTDGSSCFLFRDALFTGDTLFAGSVGGAYGDASTYDDILTSVRTSIFSLPDTTQLMPGHGPPSIVGDEKRHDPFFIDG